MATRETSGLTTWISEHPNLEEIEENNIKITLWW